MSSLVTPQVEEQAQSESRMKASDLLKALAIVVVFSWFAFSGSRLHSVIDADLGWHLRSGEWILQHHQLPHHDPFSIGGMQKNWVAYSWPFSVLLYLVSRVWDFQGIMALTVIFWMAISIGVFSLARGLTRNFWLQIGVTAAVGGILTRIVAPRPGMFTLLFFILMLHILLSAQRTGHTKRLWWLPVIIWMWAGVHVQFLYGLFVIGLFCIEPLLNRIFKYEGKTLPRWLWAVLGISAVLTVANPYGAGSYEVVLDFVRQPLHYVYINEFHAMAFASYANYVVLFMTLTAAFAMGRKRPIRPMWVVLLVWAAALSFHAERDIWLIAVVASVIIADCWEVREAPCKLARPGWLAASLVVLLLFVASIRIGPTNEQLLSTMADIMPLGAVAYIHEHHLQGPIFNDFNSGGFLIYALPEWPVAIDGRTNVHGQDEMTVSFRTWNVWAGWKNDPMFQNANLIIAPRRFSLTQVLAMDDHFKPVFADGTTVLFQRVK